MDSTNLLNASVTGSGYLAKKTLTKKLITTTEPSTYKNRRPIDILEYLLIKATITSVPPVQPLTENTKPRPRPVSTEPIAKAKTGWSCSTISLKLSISAGLGTAQWVVYLRIKPMKNIPIKVLMKKFLFKNKNAKSNKK